MLRTILLCALLAAAPVAAYAQFNRCLPGFCNLVVSGSGPAPCVGTATGQVDFSVCSNVSYVAIMLM